MVNFVVTPTVQTALEGNSLKFNISIQNPNYASVGSYRIYWRTNATADHAASGSDFDRVTTLQSLTFSSSSAQSFSFSIATHTDGLTEGDEYFEVDLYDFNQDFLRGSNVTFTIQDAIADLQVGDLRLGQSTVQAGAGLSVDFSLFNAGNATAGASTAQLFLSDDRFITASDRLLQSFSVPALAASGTYDSPGKSYVIPADLAPGTYYIGVVADTGGAVPESSEANNSFARSFTVTAAARPDLAIGGLSLGSTSVLAGTGVSVNFSVVNAGAASAPGSTTSIYLSRDPTLDSGDTLLMRFDTGPLAAGQSTTGGFSAPIPSSLAAGTWYVGIVADSGSTIGESNEANNSLSASFTVTAAGAPPGSGASGASALISRLIQAGQGAGPGQGYDAHPRWIEVGTPTPGSENKPLTHTGVDIVANLGAQIHPFAAGVVIATSQSERYEDSLGNYVLIRHPVSGAFAANAAVADGREFYTIYLHMNDAPPVTVGQTVVAGDVIGTVGHSGAAQGVNHLHFEIRLFPDTFDPFPEWFKPGGGANIYVFQDVSAAQLMHGGNGWLDPLAAPIPAASAPASGMSTSGPDQIFGGPGADVIDGLAGADTINGGDGFNYLRGGDGNDVVTGGSDFDDINGNAGSDTLHGGSGGDWVVGGKDDDLQYGDAGSDIVLGNLGNDTLDGGADADQVRGGQGNDVLLGGGGDDYVSGDRGNDTVGGGPGADVFHTFGDAGLDRVLDFNRAEGDRVLIDLGTTWSVAQQGGDVIITMSGGAQMVLVGVSMSSLTDGWIGAGLA